MQRISFGWDLVHSDVHVYTSRPVFLSLTSLSRHIRVQFAGSQEIATIEGFMGDDVGHVGLHVQSSSLQRE